MRQVSTTMRQGAHRIGGRRDFGTYALYAGSALLVGATGAAAFYLYSQPPDPVAACKGGKANAHVIVLLDGTDVLTPLHRERVRITALEAAATLPTGGRLTVLLLDATNPAAPTELLSVCSPGRPDTHNPLIETASQAVARWNADIVGPLHAALQRLSASTPSNTSPLLASISSLRTRPDYDSRSPQLRLYIISDFVEHSPGIYSHLAGGDYMRAYSASALAQTAPLDFHGVRVSLDYLHRAKFATIQGASHRRFWFDLLTRAGAEDVTFVGLDRPFEQAPPRPPREAPRPAVRPTRPR